MLAASVPTTCEGERMDASTLKAEEQRLTSILTTWAAASVVGGGTLWALGHGRNSPNLSAFGRQTLMWGAIDGAIAAVAFTGSRRRAPYADDAEVQAHRTRLRRILLINSVADVGYITAGAAVIARDRSSRRTPKLNAGDGAAIAVQGTFLLALDSVMAWRLRD